MFSLDRLDTAIPLRSHGESRPDKNGFTPIEVTAPWVVGSFSGTFQVRYRTLQVCPFTVESTKIVRHRRNTEHAISIAIN